MKKRATPKRKTKAFTFTVPLALAPQIEAQAKAQGRNRSNYLSWLIAKDIKELKLRTAEPNVME
jgi:hypothetical protein